MNKKISLVLTGAVLVLMLTSLSVSLAENPVDITTPKKSFDPKPASASLYNLGLKSYEQGDLESSISFFKRSIDLDPDFVDAYFNLGAIYKRQKNFPLATLAFQKAVDINSEDEEAIYELAACYMQEKVYDKAKQYFSLLPASSPKYNEARQYLEKINTYLAIESANSSTKKDLQTPIDSTSQQFQAQLLVETLTKPNEESFKNPFKTVSGNFNGPTGIAKDSQNNIYIANFTKNRIERVTSDGKKEIFIEKFGVQGPVGIAIDGNDNLYIANYNGDSIVKVTPNKELTVLVNKVVKPYYLFYDKSSDKLFATVQGNDSLIEIDTINLSKQPITAN